MDTDEKIRRLMLNIEEDIEKLLDLRQTKPDLTLQSIEVRSWLLALKINFDNLMHSLKDVQPTLF